MHPDRGIVHIYRHSYGLSNIPDGPNKPTCQSTGINEAPRYLLHGPVTWNPVQHVQSTSMDESTATVLASPSPS